ncbi:MAG: regulatory protein RecX [Gaiellaceae bacterium]
MPAEDAFEVALRLLRHRDLAEEELRRRLEARGLRTSEIGEALERLARTGLVDDARYAHARASSLATRGAGDALIRSDLERAGVAGEVVDDALGTLAPERDRAREIVARRGATTKTMRYLRAKGFGDDAVYAFVADGPGDELG